MNYLDALLHLIIVGGTHDKEVEILPGDRSGLVVHLNRNFLFITNFII